MEFGLLLQQKTHVFSSSVASAALFVFRRDPSAFASSWQWAQWVGQDILHVYTYTLRYQDHLAEEVSVCLQNNILAFHSGMSLC